LKIRAEWDCQYDGVIFFANLLLFWHLYPPVSKVVRLVTLDPLCPLLLLLLSLKFWCLILIMVDPTKVSYPQNKHLYSMSITAKLLYVSTYEKLTCVAILKKFYPMSFNFANKSWSIKFML